MRVLQINATCSSGSTGRICENISRALTDSNIENRVLYFWGSSNYPLAKKCADNGYIKRQALTSRVFGNDGFGSAKATKTVIEEIERFEPDVIHLHNIHGHSVDLERLFRFLKERSIRTIWTFHDCWAFTGYCAYFDLVSCNKWKTACHHCPKRKKYSWFFDRSQTLFERKKALIPAVSPTIVTPSVWLSKLAKQSFLKDCDVKVIHNGIDLNVFHPSPSDFREKHQISPDQFLLLGVSFEWETRKGLDVFLSLAETLDQERYRIVLVGTNETVDAQLPKNIISVHRTQNAAQLAEIYSAADLFVNPTREDNYPTVNMEALACGTPVVTFFTGGSPEMLSESTGSVARDPDEMTAQIIDICEHHRFSSEDCVRRAKEACDEKQAVRNYLDLYQSLR